MEVAAAVERARAAAGWWAGLGVAGRRARLLGFGSVLANRMPELAELLGRECGKPIVEGGDRDRRGAPPPRLGGQQRPPGAGPAPGPRVNGRPGVLGPGGGPAAGRGRRHRTLERPGGRALGAGGLGAGRRQRHVSKPSQSSPGISQWLADRFAEVVPEQPVLQLVHGLGASGAALGRSGVDKLAFIGATATAKQVMATCAETLTPLLAEGGGKDAMIVAADADLDAAAKAARFGALGNAGQTCTGIERVDVAAAVADGLLQRLITRAQQLTVGRVKNPTSSDSSLVASGGGS